MDDYINSFFTKKKQHPDKVLINLINDAKETIDIAIYTITKKEIVQAIIDAKNRGISIRIILDKQEINGKYEKLAIELLQDINIPMRVNKHSGLMHLKVAIIDRIIVAAGSYNYTEAASNENDEVLIVIRELKSVKEFMDIFDTMWFDNKKFKDYLKDQGEF